MDTLSHNAHHRQIVRRGFAALGLGDWDTYLREKAVAGGRELGAVVSELGSSNLAWGKHPIARGQLTA